MTDDWGDGIDELEDFERLPCSLTYVVVCILLPLLNGQTNALIFPAYTIHFENNGWSVVRAGLAVTVAFVIRIISQQVTLRAGYWLAVPLGMVHLVFAVLGMIFLDQEWAIFAEIVVALGIDPTMAIEGLAFDSFGSSEVQARQATSTCLSVFTLALSLSCTVGGIIFDTLGWRGIGAYHTTCQGLLVLVLCLQPGCRRSFMEFFQRDVEDEESETQNQEPVFKQVVPGDSARVLPVSEADKSADLAVVEMSEADPVAQSSHSSEPIRSTKGSGGTPRNTADSAAGNVRGTQGSGGTPRNTAGSGAGNARMQGSAGTPSILNSQGSASAIRNSKGSFTTPNSGQTNKTVKSRYTHVTQRSRATFARRISRTSGITAITDKSARTTKTAKTAGTFLTSMSHMTALSEAGQDFRHHFGTNNALQPHIASRKPVVRDMIDEEEEGIMDVKKQQSRKSRANIPKDTRFPCALVVMTAFYNNCTYVIEFATFAIFFRQVHNWNEATWASIAQTSGDLCAAIAMQVIPALFPTSIDPESAGCLKRFWLIITSPPYNLSLILASWTLFNLGMMSPLLPIALVSQVLMGTSYVYSSKWTTDMNLFYSLGDSQVFLSLQVVTRNAEAVGGALAGVLGTWLYSIDPNMPFLVCTGVGFLAFLTYTVGFCWRLGYCDDIEVAEQKRARRKGLRRVSSWAVERTTTREDA